jgi:hypothetical protein
MRTGAIVSAITLLTCACSETTPPPSPAPQPEVRAEPTPDVLADYRSLVGNWVDRTNSPKFTCFERWTAEGDTALRGFGYVMAKGDTVFIEDLRLEEVDGKVIYSARIDSQNNGQWVPFTAQESGPDSLIFENPGHDFPQCITYVKDSTSGWEVAVTGNENGSDRAERFRFVRL